jgi:hypothetical protein
LPVVALAGKTVPVTVRVVVVVPVVIAPVFLENLLVGVLPLKQV